MKKSTAFILRASFYNLKTNLPLCSSHIQGLSVRLTDLPWRIPYLPCSLFICLLSPHMSRRGKILLLDDRANEEPLNCHRHSSSSPFRVINLLTTVSSYFFTIIHLILTLTSTFFSNQIHIMSSYTVCHHL